MQLPLSVGALLMRLMTYNIRYAANPTSSGEQPWAVRAPRLIAQVRFETISNLNAFVGFQEVLHEQLVDILTGLNSNISQTELPWDYIGVGRDDGKEAGEYSPIFFRPAVWQLQNWTTIWLSPTPNVPSKGWDAGSIRILTIGDFYHRQTGAWIIAMNTHFDNVGTISRLNSAKIVTNEINKRLNVTSYGKRPSILLTGDLNSEPGQEAYQYFTRPTSPIFDVRDKIPEAYRYGNRNGTFTGFDGETGHLLDHIFLDKRSSWIPKTYAELPNKFDDDIYLSDHMSVASDVELDCGTSQP